MADLTNFTIKTNEYPTTTIVESGTSDVPTDVTSSTKYSKRKGKSGKPKYVNFGEMTVKEAESLLSEIMRCVLDGVHIEKHLMYFIKNIHRSPLLNASAGFERIMTDALNSIGYNVQWTKGMSRKLKRKTYKHILYLKNRKSNAFLDYVLHIPYNKTNPIKALFVTDVGFDDLMVPKFLIDEIMMKKKGTKKYYGPVMKFLSYACGDEDGWNKIRAVACDGVIRIVDSSLTATDVVQILHATLSDDYTETRIAPGVITVEMLVEYFGTHYVEDVDPFLLTIDQYESDGEIDTVDAVDAVDTVDAVDAVDHNDVEVDVADSAPTTPTGNTGRWSNMIQLASVVQTVDGVVEDTIDETV